MKKLMAFAGIAVIVGSLAYMIFANPHVPLLDANRTVLAETPLEGYCAGTVFLPSRGQGDAESAAMCREDNPQGYSNKINHHAVQFHFCLGLVDSGWSGTESECVDISSQQRIWPTLDGSITNAWNRAFPYPLEHTMEDQANRSDSRTGDRDDNQRDDSITR